MLTYMHPEAVRRFAEKNGLGGLRPSLETLTRLGGAFGRIPYENLTKIIMFHTASDLAAAIRLPELLYEEHLRFGTGGTCFSMTYFLQTILRSFGFNTYPVSADRPLAPNTHCASIIMLDNKKYLLDPGFMIDRPLLLTEIPTRHSLRHTDIIIGSRDAVPISPPRYTLTTVVRDKTNIRYYLKDSALSEERFYELWLDSFRWPGLRNASIAVTTANGYIYARNNFLRTTTREGKDQLRIRAGLDSELGKRFNIDSRIIKAAFEALREAKDVRRDGAR